MAKIHVEVFVEPAGFKFKAEVSPELLEPYWILLAAAGRVNEEAKKYMPPASPVEPDKDVRERPPAE